QIPGLLPCSWLARMNLNDKETRRSERRHATCRQFPHTSLPIRPRACSSLYTYPSATSVEFLPSVSFLLAFAEHLGIQNAGEEDVDQLTQIIRATDYDVNFYLSPSNGFACGKSQIDTASRNKAMEQNSWNLN